MSVTGKELPFKTNIQVNSTQQYEKVISWINSVDKPIMVLDDANYLMSNFEVATINETGYGKFARNALGMVQVFNAMIAKDSDQTFYVMAHTEQDEEGKLRFKTTGKMVSEKYNPAGITNIVLEAAYDDDDFVFRVKSDGRGIKAPLGMFKDATVPNDLKVVDKTIREFYGEGAKK